MAAEYKLNEQENTSQRNASFELADVLETEKVDNLMVINKGSGCCRLQNTELQ
jgi:hypothetical protein